MELTQGERLSSLWAKLYSYLEEDLHSAHLRLEKIGTTDQATSEIRGQIKAIRKLMDLNNPKPSVE